MKHLLLLITALFFVNGSVFANTASIDIISLQKQLVTLEHSFDGKIGVYAIDTNNNYIIAHRENERFPVQSTAKFMGVAALLQKSSKDKNLLQEKICYTKSELMFWHPVTGQCVAHGMTLKSLAQASISYSDNTAFNLIMKKLGGPKAVTAFAHAIGNQTFNIEHYEGALNSDPNNPQDTSTPKDMAMSVQRLTLGSILLSSQRVQLVTWMRNNTTGYQRIRAGVPIGWVVADKTGSGDYGIANDIGILWPPTCKPIILAIYTVRHQPNAKIRDDVVASTTRIILNEFAKHNACFKALFS